MRGTLHTQGKNCLNLSVTFQGGPPNSSTRASPTKPKSVKELSKELRPRSSLSKSLKCQHCLFSCDKKPELNLHLKSKHKKPARPVTFTSKALVDAMASNFNSGIPGKSHLNDESGLKCRHCHFCAKTSSDLRNHFRTKHSSDEENFPDNESGPEDINSCQFCSSKFDCFKSLKSHIRKRHRDRLKYKCNKCNFASNFHAGLAYHIKTKHADGGDDDDDGVRHDKNVVIKSNFVVDEIFDEKSSVSSDGRREGSSLGCRQCNFVAKSASQLDRHTKSKHSKSNSRENSFVRDEVADPNSSSDEETPANLVPSKIKGSSSHYSCPVLEAYHWYNKLTKCSKIIPTSISILLINRSTNRRFRIIIMKDTKTF